MRLRLIALSLLMGVLSVGWALGVPQQLIQSMASLVVQKTFLSLMIDGSGG